MIEQTPRWLRTLEKHFSWLSIPQIAIILVTLQGLGFLMVLNDPVWIDRLALIPNAVFEGQYWRLITFLALPVSLNFFWVLISLWFLYFIVNQIEYEWGEFKTTLYVLISVVLTIAVSLILDFPVTQASDFESTLFLAAAALFPEMEIRLFFVLPVKMKWLAWLSLGFLAVRLVGESWYGRIYLLAIYSNALLFFGPALFYRVKQFIRRQQFKRKFKD